MSRNAKKVKKVVFKFILFALLGYVIFIFIDQFIKIKTRSDELNSYKEKISVQEEKKREMQQELQGRSNASEEGGNSFGGKNSGTIVFENVTE